MTLIQIAQNYKRWVSSLDYKSYLKNKCFIGYGLINGIINAIIFYLINRSDMLKAYTFGSALEEMAMTTLLLGLILTWCVVPLTKKDLNSVVYIKGSISKIASKLPKGAIALSIVVGLICLVAGSLVSSIIVTILGCSFNAWTMMVVKGIVCALTGALAGYLVIESVSYNA